MIRKHESNWKKSLQPEEEKQLNALIYRVQRICEAAANAKIPVLINAELHKTQPAIDYVALYMAQKFNTKDCLIYNTYQTYMYDGIGRLQHHQELSKERKFHFGCAIVRGEYHQEEAKSGNESYIKNRFLVDQLYKHAMVFVFGQLNKGDRISILLGTHSLESVLQMGLILGDLRIPFTHPNIQLAQLYGMGKNISLGLVDFHFKVSQLVPYGTEFIVLN